MKSYDAIVVGGGPGGYVCALRLAKNGKKTALIENRQVGGTCLNRGCIPTKALLGSAAAARALGRGEEFGFTASDIHLHYDKAYMRSQEVVAKLVGGVQGLLKKNGVDVVYDHARFIAPKTLATKKHGEFSAQNVVIATGSRPAALPLFDGLDAALYPENALALAEAPKSAVIIGAGAIGVEFAYLWNTYGCKVTLLETADRILPGFDEEVGGFIGKELEKLGVGVLAGARAEAASKTARGIAVSASTGHSTRTLEAETLLISAGIRPNTDDIGAEAAGVRLDSRGYIQVDAAMRTGVPGVYAVGDVNGLLALAHAASAQGVIAADAICGKDTQALDYSLIPRCVYCVPEAAMVGRTEKQCAEHGKAVTVGKYHFGGSGKALGEGEANGFVKVVAAKDTNEILGVHIAGPHASELITQCTILMQYEITADEVEKIVFPHPSLSEVVMEAMGDACGNAVHK